MSAWVLCACASGGPERSQLDELKAELRAMRESQIQLERRFERLEAQNAVMTSRPISSASPGPSGTEIPELTVVKLKPKAEPAPKLDVRTPVAEPSPEMVEALVAAAPSSRERSTEKEEALDPEVAEAYLERGLSALRTGNVEGGVEKLRAFAEENPKHPKSDNALYFAGLGLMGLSDHTAASKVFETLLARYPAGDAVLDAMLKLAECRMRLNQPSDAKALFTRVVMNYPGTAAATLAESRLAALPK